MREGKEGERREEGRREEGERERERERERGEGEGMEGKESERVGRKERVRRERGSERHAACTHELPWGRGTPHPPLVGEPMSVVLGALAVCGQRVQVLLAQVGRPRQLRLLAHQTLAQRHLRTLSHHRRLLRAEHGTMTMQNTVQYLYNGSIN